MIAPYISLGPAELDGVKIDEAYDLGVAVGKQRAARPDGRALSCPVRRRLDGRPAGRGGGARHARADPAPWHRHAFEVPYSLRWALEIPIKDQDRFPNPQQKKRDHRPPAASANGRHKPYTIAMDQSATRWS
jgi:hypothetical protein